MQGRKERRADAVETVSAAGGTSEVACEESRVNWAKKHTHKHVLLVCRKQGTYRNGTLAAEAGHITPCPQWCLQCAEHCVIRRDQINRGLCSQAQNVLPNIMQTARDTKRIEKGEEM